MAQQATLPLVTHSRGPEFFLVGCQEHGRPRHITGLSQEPRIWVCPKRHSTEVGLVTQRPSYLVCRVSYWGGGGYTGKQGRSQTPQPTVWLVLEGEPVPFKATAVTSPHTCWLSSQWRKQKQGLPTTPTFWHHRLTDQIATARSDIPGQKILTSASNLTR